MKFRSTLAVLAVAVVAGHLGAGTAGAVLVTFEEGLGNNGAEINTQYSGITFQSATSGIPWYYADATTGLYNTSSWPSGQQWNTGEYWINDSVCAWTTESGEDGKIAFDNQDASYVQLNYSSNGTFYLEAYNAGGVQLDTATGEANLRYAHSNPSGPGTLQVNAPPGESIAYVLVHDEGNYWVIDNVATDAGGIQVPGDLQIVKFLDLDEDGRLDPGERFLPGWQYLVEGPEGFSQTITTGLSGEVTLDELAPGNYQVTDIVRSDWTCTTANPQMITVAEGATSVAVFGNVPEPGTLTLLALGACLALLRRKRK
jgi:hypothetical protein